MSLVKTITIDGFYSNSEAENISNIIVNLNFQEMEYGQEIENFNMIPPNADEMFSKVLKNSVNVYEKTSGIFRKPNNSLVHFESFDNTSEWIFAVALQNSTFNIYEHESGSKTALNGYKYNYKNFFEWNLTVNYLLQPGQGIFFRPWLFHSFDAGLIQIFRLIEI